MEKAPQISVIIPVYNTEKYLKQCVDSVLNQSYQDFEIILVDDGSKDSSGEICDDYSKSDDRIHVIHKENGGQSSARNAALDIAQGKYVYFLDSDDYIGADLLFELVSVAEKNSADFVFFEAQSFFDDGEKQLNKKIHKHYEYYRKNKYENCNGQKQYIRLKNNDEFFVCTPLHFYKKMYLDDNCIRFKEGIIHEDNLFSAEVYICDGIAVHMQSSEYYRRLRVQSTMTDKNIEHQAFRFKSLLSVYYSVSELVAKKHPDKEMIRLLITDSFDGVTYSFQDWSEENRKRFRGEYKKLKLHCLLHYGKYDYQLARKCSGITKPLLRATHGFCALIKELTNNSE